VLEGTGIGNGSDRGKVGDIDGERIILVVFGETVLLRIGGKCGYSIISASARNPYVNEECHNYKITKQHTEGLFRFSRRAGDGDLDVPRNGDNFGDDEMPCLPNNSLLFLCCVASIDAW